MRICVIDHANPAVFVLVFIAIAIVMHALAGRDVFTPVLPDSGPLYKRLFAHVGHRTKKAHVHVVLLQGRFRI